MGKGDVSMKFSGETADFVNKVLKARDAMKDTADQGRKMGETIVKHGDESSHAMEKMGESAKAMIGAFIGVESIGELFRNVKEEIMHSREEVIKFHETSKGGAILGSNLDNLPGYKERSIALSNQFATPIEQINKFREEVARKVGTSAASADERKEYEDAALDMKEVTGADPMAAFGAMRSLRDTYQSMSIKESQRFVEFANQKGGMSASDLSGILPSILPTIGEMGMPQEQLQALIATVAKSGGSESGMGKALIAGFLKLPELMEQGPKEAGHKRRGAIIHKGDDLPTILDELKEFHDKDQAEFDKTFGRRGAGAMYQIAAHREVFNQALDDQKSFPADPIAEEKAKLLKDRGSSLSADAGKIDTADANSGLSIPDDQFQAINKYFAAVAAYKKRTAPGIKFLSYANAAIDIFGQGGDETMAALGMQDAGVDWRDNKGIHQVQNLKELQPKTPKITQNRDGSYNLNPNLPANEHQWEQPAGSQAPGLMAGVLQNLLAAVHGLTAATQKHADATAKLAAAPTLNRHSIDSINLTENKDPHAVAARQ